MKPKLIEKRNELAAKQAKLAGILEASKSPSGEYDFTNCKELAGETSEQKVDSFQQLHDEVNDLAREVGRLSIEEKAANIQEIGERLKRVGSSMPSLPEGMRAKSAGEMFIESEEYRGFRETKGAQKQLSVSLELEVKTLLETGAGWAPESARTGRVVEAVTRPIQILDFIPSTNTEQPSVVYMEETLRTHNAAERAEGGAYAEDAYELVERNSQVRSIATSIPVTDEQLEDVGPVQSFVDGRLRFGVRQRLDGQVLNGDGTSPNLRGILNTVGIQTQAKGSDPTFDAFMKALTKVRVTGRAFPDAGVLNPFDWQAIRLTRTADGIYILGNPADPGPMQLFGCPITLSDAIAENTGLVGDFTNFCQLYTKRGVIVEIGYVNNQFAEGKRTMRASVRAAFVVYRPAAFCTITGI